MGNKEVTLLVLLDLSVAFDTMEHSIFLNILQQDFGVVGTALKWIASFLSGPRQRIIVGDKTSDDFSDCTTVPTLLSTIVALYCSPPGRIRVAQEQYPVPPLC